jgi:hypothetical protein
MYRSLVAFFEGIIEVSGFRGSGCRAISRRGMGYNRFYLTGYAFWNLGVLSKGVEEPRSFL